MTDPYRTTAKPARLPVFYVHISYRVGADQVYIFNDFVRAGDRLAALEKALFTQKIVKTSVWHWRVISDEDFAEAQEKSE